MAKGVQHVFSDLGEPDAYIKGDEGSGAFVVGLRYGSGWLVRTTREPQQVYWKGPSVGFDVGGNASKCFTLVYDLREDRRLFQRFPGVEGSFYLVAGLGINYLRSGGVTLAPMRTGIGLRAGVKRYGSFRQARLVPAVAEAACHAAGAALALGAFRLGAVAVGALAIGAVAIGGCGRACIKRKSTNLSCGGAFLSFQGELRLT